MLSREDIIQQTRASSRFCAKGPGRKQEGKHPLVAEGSCVPVGNRGSSGRPAPCPTVHSSLCSTDRPLPPPLCSRARALGRRDRNPALGSVTAREAERQEGRTGWVVPAGCAQQPCQEDWVRGPWPEGSQPCLLERVDPGSCAGSTGLGTLSCGLTPRGQRGGPGDT